jgi:hypothetical protein
MRWIEFVQTDKIKGTKIKGTATVFHSDKRMIIRSPSTFFERHRTLKERMPDARIKYTQQFRNIEI